MANETAAQREGRKLSQLDVEHSGTDNPNHRGYRLAMVELQTGSTWALQRLENGKMVEQVIGDAGEIDAEVAKRGLSFRHHDPIETSPLGSEASNLAIADWKTRLEVQSENNTDEPVWTVQQFSTNPVGEPYFSLRKYDQHDQVIQGFTGTRQEIDKLIADHQLTVTELPPVTESEYYRQALEAPKTEHEETKLSGGNEQALDPAGEKAELIRQLREFAGARSQLPYVQPEAAMAANVAQQLESGAKVIDLTQRYATSDSEVARERHKDAVQNMKVALRLAGKHGQIEEGNAIAHGTLKQNETLAVNQNFKRGLANGANVLRAAGQHQQHSVQTPRLSISGNGLGGGI